MAIEEFDKEPLSKREKNLVQMRSLTNYVMGILILAAGILFLFPPEILQRKLDANQNDPVLIKILGVVCVIYGAFRIYRGYKKNYFRNQ
jgi:uncharacterized membrane protein HdeD (DUF308 family)